MFLIVSESLQNSIIDKLRAYIYRERVVVMCDYLNLAAPSLIFVSYPTRKKMFGRSNCQIHLGSFLILIYDDL